MDQDSVSTNHECMLNEQLHGNHLPNEEISDTGETPRNEIEGSISSVQEKENNVDILGGGDCIIHGESELIEEKSKIVIHSTLPTISVESTEDETLGFRTFTSDDTSNACEAVKDEQSEAVIDSYSVANLTSPDEIAAGNHSWNKSASGVQDECQKLETSHDGKNVSVESKEKVCITHEDTGHEGRVETNDVIGKDTFCPPRCTVKDNLEGDNENCHRMEVKEKMEKFEKITDNTQVGEDNGEEIGTEAEKVADDVAASDSQKTRSRTYPFKVLVSGLPLSARLEEITCYFSQFGEVLKTFIEGRHRANIIFSNDESVKKAVFYTDPYFDDHKLLIRSVNEVTAVIMGIPRSLPMKEAEKAVINAMQAASVPVCRVLLPLSDSFDQNKQLLQGHAFVVFCDQQLLQNAEEKQKQEPFIIADSPVVLFPSVNQFYKQFCVRVFPLPPEHPRSLVCQRVHARLSECGEIIALTCLYVASSSAYALYVLYATEEAVKKALEMEDVKVLEQFVEIQEFHQFEPGQGFRYLWLKVLNLPQRVTITEIKHHFKHDKGILNVELDLDFGSCFIQVDSEHAIQRCLAMHQTYLRGKCISVLIADEHPGRNSYFRGGRQGRNRPNYNNNNNRNMKKNIGGGSKGFGSSNGQSSGKQERKGFDRRDTKFFKSRNSTSEGLQETQRNVQVDGVAI